jgi:LPS sulfotransferase NodH
MHWDKNRWVLDDDETVAKPSDLDYVVTGIPRSGTSLMSTILSSSENSLCFNEVHYQIPVLPSFFSEMRHRIDAGLPIINKINQKGKLTTDTQRQDGVQFSEMHVNGKDIPIKLGSKVNVPYLNKIKDIEKCGYKIVAMVRDPAYTLASWNDAKVSNIPEANVSGPTQHKRWDMFSFSTESKLERQLIIWEHYANIINSLSSNSLIVNYESLVKNPRETISKVCNFLDITAPKTIPEIVDGNSSGKYPSIHEITDIINQKSTMKNIFKY